MIIFLFRYKKPGWFSRVVYGSRTTIFWFHGVFCLLPPIILQALWVRNRADSSPLVPFVLHTIVAPQVCCCCGCLFPPWLAPESPHLGRRLESAPVPFLSVSLLQSLEIVWGAQMWSWRERDKEGGLWERRVSSVEWGTPLGHGDRLQSQSLLHEISTRDMVLGWGSVYTCEPCIIIEL